MTIAEWERQLVGTDDEPGLLDLYFIGVYQDLAIWMCKRCPHVQIIARDMDGDQTNLTLGEMVETALAHEREKHETADERASWIADDAKQQRRADR